MPNYIDGRTNKKYYCINCGKRISVLHLKCRSCSKIGNNNSLGHKHTKEHCDKISKSLIGNKRALGFSHTKSAKRAMSKFRIGNKYAYIHGHCREPYSIKFDDKLKNIIRERDGNICQLCNKRRYGMELDVHHIDYNKKNCEDDNLISLHRGCNIQVNYNRDYWFAYFKFVMEKKRCEQLAIPQ